MIKHPVIITIDCSNKTPDQVDASLKEEFNYRDVKDKIVLIRIKGKLKLGKLMDINLRDLMKSVYEKGAYFVMKNTNAVTSEEFEEIKKSFNPDLIEDEVIKEHLGQIKVEGTTPEKEKQLILDLISTLSKEKQEGETNPVYEERILKDIDFLE